MKDPRSTGKAASTFNRIFWEKPPERGLSYLFSSCHEKSLRAGGIHQRPPYFLPDLEGVDVES